MSLINGPLKVKRFSNGRGDDTDHGPDPALDPTLDHGLDPALDRGLDPGEDPIRPEDEAVAEPGVDTHPATDLLAQLAQLQGRPAPAHLPDSWIVRPAEPEPEPAPERESPAPVADEARTSSQAAARLLEIATRQADELVADAHQEGEVIVAQARVEADRLVAEARLVAEDRCAEADREVANTRAEADRLRREDDRRRADVQARLDRLATLERETRERLTDYFEDQLNAIRQAAGPSEESDAAEGHEG